MELPPSVFAVFGATALLSAGLLAIVLVVDLLTLGPAAGSPAYSRRTLALGWTAAPMLILAALLTAISGVTRGL